MKRINITLDDIVNERAEKFCKDHNISKSALIGTALTDYITAQELLPGLQIQIDALKEQLQAIAMK